MPPGPPATPLAEPPPDPVEQTGGRLGDVVHVYRNLNRPGVVWSVRRGGRVVAHVERLVLADAAFRVQPAGKARAHREGRRNVHAYVAGRLADPAAAPAAGWRAVRYRPFDDAGFVDAESGAPLADAPWVAFSPDGCAHAPAA